MKSYKGQKVAILGYGVEGRAAYEYWHKLGAKITIHDSNPDLKIPAGATSVLGPDYLEGLDNYDLIVRSPGVFPHLFETTARVTSVTNEFLGRCPATVIGITGTKGKGTTTTLIHHILTTAVRLGSPSMTGRTAYLGGNIGQPPLEFLDHIKPSDYAVLEMSNVQLWDITRSPQIAVLLMIAPEHMDWHQGDMDEYVMTKANITKFQSQDDLLVFHGANQYTTEIAHNTKANRLPYFVDLPGPKPKQLKAVWFDGGDIKMAETVICNVKDVPLTGRHNLQNVCAAIGATFGIVKESAIIREAIKTYKALPHRLELVGEVAGVKYYDDSIATHELAAIAAIEAFKEPKIMILGGSDKGVEYPELAREIVNNNVKAVVLIGATAPKLQSALEAANYPSSKIVTGINDMPDIVRAAAQASSAGNVVLLSPACASFGMFRDYADRGDQFKAAVNKIKLLGKA